MSLISDVAAVATWTPEPAVLLSPPIPAPMHGLAPRTVMGQKWWDAVRFAAMKSTNCCCIACKVRRGGICTETRDVKLSHHCDRLDGHEMYDIDHLLGRMTYLRTVPLCSWCHSYVHRGYLNLQVSEGIVSIKDRDRIIAHGNIVLRRAGLEPPNHRTDFTQTEWGEWRLVIGDEEYRPLWASYQEYVDNIGAKRTK